jgi:hypothetical protein
MVADRNRVASQKAGASIGYEAVLREVSLPSQASGAAAALLVEQIHSPDALSGN